MINQQQKRLMLDYYCCFLFLILIKQNNAISSGDVGICDADFPKFGCASGWGLADQTTNQFGAVRVIEDRFKCLDADAKTRIMSWAKAPEKTPNYVITTSRKGNGPTKYKPGGMYQQIHVLALEYYKKYRGIMLYAVDKNNKPVGSWALPDDPNFNLWHPPICGPTHVLHQDSGIKDFNYAFQYRTPPSGTGPITFKALFKVGPANTGEFYLPETPLILQEDETEKGAANNNWAVGNIGESCDDVCYKQKMQCETAKLVKEMPKTTEEFQLLTKHLFPCNPPILSDCKMGSPAASGDYDYQCYIHDEQFCNSKFNDGETKTTVESVKCEASGIERRFCICKDVNGRRLLRLSNNNNINGIDTTHIDDKQYKYLFIFTLYYSLVKPLCLFIFVCAFAFKFLINMRKKNEMSHFSSFAVMIIFFGFIISLILLISSSSNNNNNNMFVAAHNWPMGRTRGSFKSPLVTRASCMPAKNDIHFQIGIDQEYLQGFSTGHGGYIMLVTVPQKYSFYLEDHRKLNKYANEYLKEAPAGSNTALDPKYKRWHAINEPLFDGLSYTRNAGPTTGCKVCPTCDVYNTYGKEEQCTFQYNNLTELADYLIYKNAKDGFVDENCCKKCREAYRGAGSPIDCNSRMRYRGKFSKSRCGDKDQGGSTSKWCKRKIKRGEPGWFSTESHGSGIGTLYEYHETHLQKLGDQRVAYTSVKYPFIDNVHKYAIWNKGQAYDWDYFKVGVSGSHGAGRYSTIMYWLGYSYCTDFEYFNDRKIEFINGDESQAVSSEWVRSDHCVFNSATKFLTPLWPADENGNCAATKEMLKDQYGFLPGKRGIQVLPVKAPRDSHPGYKLPLSFNDSNLMVGSPYMLLNGTVSRSDRGASFFARTKSQWAKTIHRGKYCKSFKNYGKITLRDALMKCATDSNNCKGIFAELYQKPDETLYTGVHEFRGCKSLGNIKTSARWTVFIRDTFDPTSSSSSSLQMPINIKFGYDQTSVSKKFLYISLYTMYNKPR